MWAADALRKGYTPVIVFDTYLDKICNRLYCINSYKELTAKGLLSYKAQLADGSMVISSDRLLNEANNNKWFDKITT